MRPRQFIRSLALAGALVALSVPVFTVSQGAHQASACSNPNCIVTVTGTTGLDTYISPITATFSSLVFNETATMAEPGPGVTVTIPGTIGFTVFDERGNNQGFSAYLYCSQPQCFTSSLSYSGIPASLVSVSGPTAVTAYYTWFGDGSGLPFTVNASGSALSAPVLVGGACPREIIGKGYYGFSVPLAISLPYPYSEFVTLPVSWLGHFALDIVEGNNVANCGTYVP